MPLPTRSRPQFPTGYLAGDLSETTMLTWEEVRQQLEHTRIFWLGTVRPDGRPHATPIWGAWVGDTYYWDGSPDTRWARNLAANPAIVVHVEREGLAIMVEGDVQFGDVDAPTLDSIAASYSARYPYRPDHTEGWYIVRPQRVFAIPEDLKRAARFTF
ncbi:MAG: pyridoxamine 5'-phosphate oxidase family protein [Chloroflexi bacterium OHK40]